MIYFQIDQVVVDSSLTNEIDRKGHNKNLADNFWFQVTSDNRRLATKGFEHTHAGNP